MSEPCDADLTALFRPVEIRDPLRTLINPAFEAIGDSLSIRIDTVDRTDGHPMTGLESRFPFSPYQRGRFVRQPHQASAFVRACLLQVLAHEMDESLWSGDARLNEPKHWGA